MTKKTVVEPPTPPAKLYIAEPFVCFHQKCRECHCDIAELLPVRVCKCFDELFVNCPQCESQHKIILSIM